MTVNKQMITLAREAVGKTQTILAREVGISQAAVSKIESGLQDPTEQVLERLAVACSVPRAFFDQPEPVLGEGLVDFFHKKRLTLPAKPLTKANAYANVARLEALRALRAIELTEVAPFPRFPHDEHQSVEEIAQLVRATWRVPAGPMPDLIAQVEAAAVPVYIASLGHEKLFAISMPGVQGRHVVVLNGQLPASAQRFALAHELGHLVMHHDVIDQSIEKAADEFASALLMPAQDIRSQLRGLRFRDLGGLKASWKVSMAALIRRAYSLGELSDRQYRTFNIQLNQLPGGRKNEPGEFEPERPRFMRHVLDHYKTDLGYTTQDLGHLLVTDVETLEERYYGTTRRALRTVGGSDAVHRLQVLPG